MDTSLIWKLLRYQPRSETYKIRVSITNRLNVVRIQDREFSIYSIATLVNSLKHLKKKNNYFNVLIKINSVCFSDNATIVLLEVLVCQIIKELGSVLIEFSKIDYRKTFFHCFEHSLFFSNVNFNQLRNSQNYLRIFNARRKYDKAFIKKFEDNIYTQSTNSIQGNVPIGDLKKHATATTSILSAVKRFESSEGIIDNELASVVSEASFELMDNAHEHSESDCIFSIKNGGVRNIETGVVYLLVSIVILNLSEYLLGSKICKLISDNNHSINPNNEAVFDAYEKHKERFNKGYDFDSFGLVSAFQKKVSSREEVGDSAISGSGLSRLLYHLEQHGYTDACYVLSGRDYLKLLPEYRNYNESGFIGFNKANDYLNDVPDRSIIRKHKINLQGTLFCLNFLVEKKEDR